MTLGSISDDVVVIQLKHSSSVYRTRGVFGPFGPYVWKYPSAAWAALVEVFPWEALGASAAGGVIVASRYGSEAGAVTGACLALGFSTLQLLRTQLFVTNQRIVQQRGLFLLSRRATPLSDLRAGRVVRLESGSKVGDVVFETSAGELRLRSLPDAGAVLDRITSLRIAAKGGRAQ